MSTLKPAIGDKTPSYPFGYGFCQCGCEKITWLKSDGVWALYRDGHEPTRKTVQTKKASDDAAPTQEDSTLRECLTEQIDLKSTARSEERRVGKESRYRRSRCD